MAAFTDISTLRAFSVVANELNMRRAAESLHISQPPLSRKIKNLEDTLGTRLFARKSYGLELTEAGKEILAIIQPLLIMQEETQRKLDSFNKTETCLIGLSTAFEQTIYEPVINALKSACKNNVEIKRAPSMQLANDVVKGHILAAWVALPINKAGLSALHAHYAEPLMAVLPEKWREFKENIELAEMNGRPFFWFSAARNPCWHEHMRKIFQQLGFKPVYIEEPLEYEVLLARIAAGEGWALIPASFAALQRKGIKYLGVRNAPSLEMGIIYKDSAGENLARKFKDCLVFGDERRI